jgi:hypothetical protein
MRSSAASKPSKIGLAVALALLGAACSSGPKSFIVLKLQVAETETVSEISGVTDVLVNVQKDTPPGTTTSPLRYDATILDGGSLTLQKNSVDRTLSVSFANEEGGTITFFVSALDAQGCVIGSGTASRDIRKGGSAEVDVPMVSKFDCNPDGGAPDGSTGLFPGCDPVRPSTTDGGATMCTATQTCQVNCTTMRNECTMGGTGEPGTLCQSNLDCKPGTQCFDYSGTGCGVKVCLRFCDTKSDCTAFGATGIGQVGSFCEGRVACTSTMDTAYHTCTFNCDPTAAAATNHGGCPGALACVMPADMDQVDCDCPAGRTQQEGQTCTAVNCAPGLICNKMNGSSICRAICRCDKVGSNCTAANTCGTGKVCTAVTNNTVYGVCL